MPLVTWTDNLSVHIKEIDTQHQKLVKLINDLFDAVTAKKGKDVLTKVLNELVDYTRYHFTAEEKLMATHNYPDLAKHKPEHEELTRKVLDFQKQFNEGKAMIDLLLMNFLKDWLVKHILGTDKKYSSYLNGKGVS
ncbi:MAG: bacteriohemerythrin [Nitrospirae bacterium]|nr:bacteriohemerythrin [Nitrospirota bacterium]